MPCALSGGGGNDGFGLGASIGVGFSSFVSGDGVCGGIAASAFSFSTSVGFSSTTISAAGLSMDFSFSCLMGSVSTMAVGTGTGVGAGGVGSRTIGVIDGGATVGISCGSSLSFSIKVGSDDVSSVLVVNSSFFSSVGIAGTTQFSVFIG